MTVFTPRISALLLAAGCSARMQGPNKLLLPIGGEALVRRTAREISKLNLRQLMVVTGHDVQKIENELADLNLEFTYNPRHLEGLHTSIRRGLASLYRPFDGFFVCLADQPAFDSQILEQMIAVFAREGGHKIIYPSCDGQRGQPVLIPAKFVDEILAHEDGDFGCSYLFQNHPDHLRAVEIENLAALHDVDTPEDLHRLKVEVYA